MPLLRDQKVQLRDHHGVPQGGMGLPQGVFNWITTFRGDSEQDRATFKARVARLTKHALESRSAGGYKPLLLSQTDPRHSPHAGVLETTPGPSRIVPLRGSTLSRLPSSARPDLILFDWPHVVHKVNQKGRRFLGDDQVTVVGKLVNGWSRFASDLLEASEKADASIDTLVKDVSGARRARLAVGSKVVWLVLTVAAPPPWGALVGALVRGALGTATWSECLRRWTEWSLQAPFPTTNGKADFLGEWRPWVQGKDTKSPPLNYIGGHPSLRELKDAHQLINHLDKAFTGKNKQLFDKYNENLFTKWLSLPPQPKHAGETAGKLLARECAQKGSEVQRQVALTVFDYAANQTHAEELVHAVLRYQEDDIQQHIRSYADPVKFVQNVVAEGIDLYLNTLGFNLIQRHTAFLDHGLIPQLDMKRVQQEFERIALARYIVETRDLAPRRSGPGVLGVDEDYWLRVYGAASSKVWSGEVETRLLELGVTRRYPGASILGTGRTDEYAARLGPWRPPALHGAWEPVPYQRGGANAQGRLAAWAVHYVDRYDRAPGTVLETFLDAR